MKWWRRDEKNHKDCLRSNPQKPQIYYFSEVNHCMKILTLKKDTITLNYKQEVNSSLWLIDFLAYLFARAGASMESSQHRQVSVNKALWKAWGSYKQQCKAQRWEEARQGLK